MGVEFISIREATNIIGIGRSEIMQLVKDKKLRSVRAGGYGPYQIRRWEAEDMAKKIKVRKGKGNEIKIQ